MSVPCLGHTRVLSKFWVGLWEITYFLRDKRVSILGYALYNVVVAGRNNKPESGFVFPPESGRPVGIMNVCVRFVLSFPKEKDDEEAIYNEHQTRRSAFSVLGKTKNAAVITFYAPILSRVNGRTVIIAVAHSVQSGNISELSFRRPTDSDKKGGRKNEVTIREVG